jgi:hypothetical protein
MKQTYQSIHIGAPIDKVWQTIRDFQDLSWAPNVITSCTNQSDKPGSELGSKRLLNEVFHETLIECDDATHTIRYSIDDGPSPVSQQDVSNYIGCLRLLQVTKDNSTFVEWSSSWESKSDDAVTFCHGIYVALLDDLAATCA